MKKPYENRKNPYFLKFRMVSKIHICTDKSVHLATLLRQIRSVFPKLEMALL